MNERDSCIYTYKMLKDIKDFGYELKKLDMRTSGVFYRITFNVPNNPMEILKAHAMIINNGIYRYCIYLNSKRYDIKQGKDLVKVLNTKSKSKIIRYEIELY